MILQVDVRQVVSEELDRPAQEEVGCQTGMLEEWEMNAAALVGINRVLDEVHVFLIDQVQPDLVLKLLKRIDDLAEMRNDVSQIGNVADVRAP